MIPVLYRLKKVRDFNLLVQQGRWRKGPLVDLKYLKLADNKDYFPKQEDPVVFANQLKIAFAVGLKISKSAVTRNRIKRQLSEIMRLLLKENKLPLGYYFLLVPQPAILKANFAQINQAMRKLFA
ncbi:MAG: ribonuclease P protein component [bacterium]|nr:ribonuclease P protein component [bacterium]